MRAEGVAGARRPCPPPPPPHTLTCTLLPPPLSFARMRLRAEGAAGARRPCASSPRPRPPPQPRPSAAPEPHSPPPPPGGLEQRPRDCCRGVQVAGGHLPRQRRQQEEEATGGCVHPSAPPRDQPSSRARTRKGGGRGGRFSHTISYHILFRALNRGAGLQAGRAHVRDDLPPAEILFTTMLYILPSVP